MTTTTDDLATTLAGALGLPHKLVDDTAHRLREAKMLAGVDAPATVEHAVVLLLGLMAAPTPADAPDCARLYRQLPFDRVNFGRTMPDIRRFYERSPLRRTKYLNQFYEMVKMATEAQRTMREMDRTYRPEFASEIEHGSENLEYRQLTNANKEMRGIVSEIRSVMRAPDLATLHQLAKELAHNRSYRPAINRLRRSRDWRDLGALKAELLDLTIMERNKHAKLVVQDIEAQRRGAAR